MMKSRHLISSFIIFLYAAVIFTAGMLLSPPTASAATGMWVTETVDGPGIVGWDSSVAVDSNGWVHISYYDSTKGELRHAVNAYGTWIIETVDGAQGDVGMYSSIAIDSSDKVHIGYFDFDRKYLMHATTNASGAWVPEIVDGAGWRGEHLSLALDSSGKVHISYYDRTNGYLRYATNAGPPPPPGSGTWTSQLVDDAGDVGWYTSIAIDSSGKAHISYYDADNMTLKYATTNISGGWDTEIVDSGGDVGWDTALVVDGSGRVHISYYDATDPLKQDLRYATGNSGSWEKVTVDSVDDVGSHSTLFVDSSGIVHIGYYDYTNGTLKYAISNSSNVADGWITETVDSSSGDVGSYSSLTIDSTGDIHISYYDGIGGDLRYAVSRSLTNLKKGFNIISAPTNTQIIPDANALIDFIDPAGDWVNKVLRYNRSTMVVEEAYRLNGTIIGNFPMTAGDGLIVYATRDMTIDLLQDVCPLLNLSAGTNWVGTPCQPEHSTAFSILQALGSANVISMQRFNPDTGSFETAAFQNGQIVGADFPIEGGRGYLLHMNADLSGFRP